MQYYRNNPYQSIQSTYQVQDQLYCIEFDQLSTLFECRVNNKTYTVQSVIWANGTCSFCVGDRNYCYSLLKNDQDIYIHHPQSGNKHIQKQQRFQIDDQKDLDGAYVSSLPGSIAAVFVKEGDVVKKGDRLVSTISMKMEHVTEAHSDGIIQQICVHEGLSLIHI